MLIWQPRHVKTFPMLCYMLLYYLKIRNYSTVSFIFLGWRWRRRSWRRWKDDSWRQSGRCQICRGLVMIWLVSEGGGRRIDEGVLRWFGHLERMENDRITKRVYEYADSRSVGRSWKRWIDTVNDYLRKKGLDVRKAKRMVHYRMNGGGLWGECMGRSAVDEPQTLTRYHNYMKPL